LINLFVGLYQSAIAIVTCPAYSYSPSIQRIIATTAQPGRQVNRISSSGIHYNA